MHKPAKFLDTNATVKRSDIKDHIKSVKQQNRQKSLVSSGNHSSTAAGGPSSLDAGSKRAKSITKSKFVSDHGDSSLFLDGHRQGTG